MFDEKAFNARKSGHKSASEIRKRRLSHNDQQRDAMSHNRIAFVRLVSNALIVSYRDPTARTHALQPNRVWRPGGEMIRVPLDIESTCSEDLRKALPEIAVREVDMAQAARS